MKLRPQFNLRFRDVEQFELVVAAASSANLSMNEWIVLRIERQLMPPLYSVDGRSGEIRRITEDGEFGRVEKAESAGGDQAGDSARRVEPGHPESGEDGGQLLANRPDAQGASGIRGNTDSAPTKTATRKSERVGENRSAAALAKRAKAHGVEVAIGSQPRLVAALGACPECGSVGGVHGKGCKSK